MINSPYNISGIFVSIRVLGQPPSKGVLKRNKSQKDFFTVAQLLKPYQMYGLGVADKIAIIQPEKDPVTMKIDAIE